MSIELSKDKNVLLDTEMGSVFGVLRPESKQMCDVLWQELTVQLFAECIPSQSGLQSGRPTLPVGKLKGSRQASPILLYANLYGPKVLFEDVGIFLARCQFFLQHPRHCNLNVEYRNPHCLTPPGSVITNTFDLFNELNQELQVGHETYVDPIDLFADPWEQDAMIEAQVPQALSTELYKHQKQALTFMLQREKGWALDQEQRDLWRSEKDLMGRITYCNIISGHKQRTPPADFCGGLLIDAPGLGKSLSVLSLIATDFENDIAVHPNKSEKTLLIVPNTCQLAF